ncbi:cytochrome P450 [Streptomyces sp. NPDC093595]|uniref:cytochrome P450 n=1 Tax=Streptomyces sp. NPDC093595 TaxID=3366045 RepID=UPI0038066CBC
MDTRSSTTTETGPKRPVVPASTIRGPKTTTMMQYVQLFRRPGEYMMDCRRKYGKQFELKVFPGFKLYVLSDPEDVKQLFLAPSDVLHTGRGSASLEKFFGQTGLAWLDEKEHLARRKGIMPSVRGSAHQRTEEAVRRMAKEAVAGWPRGKAVALRPYVHKFTIQVIREVVFGKHVPSCWDELFEVIWDMLKLNASVATMIETHEMSPLGVRLLRAIKPLGLDRFFKNRDRCDQLIAQAIAERVNSGEPGDDMLAMMLGMTTEDGSPLSAVELRDEIMTMFVAGTETTAAAICWSLEHLTREPAVFQRLLAEIDEGAGDEYLTATVIESLRRWPPNPHIIPREVVKPIEIGGVRYEPGCMLWASAYLVHHDPKVYPDPYEFRPERFLGVKPSTSTWIPFGGGRVRCLGDRIAMVEMKEVLRELLTTCDLHRPDMTPEVPVGRSVTMTPKRGAQLELRPRKNRPRPTG